MAKQTIKFEYGTDFQELILKYTLTDKKGYKALDLYDDSHFALLEHAVIVNALKKYYKKKKRIPEKAMLKETLRNLYQSQKAMYSALNEKDRNNINTLVDSLYQGTVADGETIMEKVKAFAQRLNFKRELEQIDIDKQDSFESAINKLKKALDTGNERSESLGTFFVSGIKDRAYKRDTLGTFTPTPFNQLNRLSNSGGIEKGSIIMLMSEAKRFKTGLMINWCRKALAKKKKGFYIDLENGEGAVTTRGEQSLMGVNQESILLGDLDTKLLKVLRKYKRIGAELVIKRMSAYTTTCADIQTWMDKVYLETGLQFDFGVIDYGDLLGCSSGKTDEFNRISDAYVEMKNLALENNLDYILTASHVKGEAAKHRATKYAQNDVAKCIDKIRHVDIALGIQESDEEIENGVMRLEIVEQRNGLRDGKVLLWVDLETQVVREFSKIEVTNYYEQLGEESPDDKKTRKKNESNTKKGGDL